MGERRSIHTSLLILALQGFSEQGQASEADFPNTALGEWTEPWQRNLSPIPRPLIHLLFRITLIISNFISQVGKQVWMIKQSAWGHIAENLGFELGLTGGAVVKNLPANAGDTRDMGSIPGLGRYPGNPGRLQSMGLQRIGQDWALAHTSHHAGV